MFSLILRLVLDRRGEMIYTTRDNDRMQSDQLKFKMNTKIGISGIKPDSNLRRQRSNAIANKSQTPSNFQSYL